jgi:hypothetical protein
MDSANKSTVISGLVQQLKAGQITKSELFERLSQLGRAGKAPAPSADQPDVAGDAQPLPDQVPAMDSHPDAAEHYPVADGSAEDPDSMNAANKSGYVSGFSSPDRRAIIQRLIDEKRRAREKNSTGGGPAPAQPQQPQPTQPLSVDEFMTYTPGATIGQEQDPQVSLLHQQARDVASAEASHITPEMSVEAQEYGMQGGNGGWQSGRVGQSQQRPQSARIDRRRMQTSVPPYPGLMGSKDDSMLDQSMDGHLMQHDGQFHGGFPQDMPHGLPESKAQKAANEIRTRNMAECTFRPQIKTLPAHYGAKDNTMPFHKRVMRWKDQKDGQKSKRANEHSEEEMLDCTFHPSINKQSKAILASSKHGQNQRASERLYENAKTSRAWEDTDAQAKEREDEEFHRTCTFKPQINSRRATPARARYRDAPQSQQQSRRKSREPATGMEECTFTPQINGLKPEMGSAKLYVQTNIYERLSQPRAEVEAMEMTMQQQQQMQMQGGNTMDMSSFMSMAGGGGQSMYNTPAQRAHGGQVDDTMDSRSEMSQSNMSMNSEDRRQSFHDFLNRQNQAEMRKQKRVEDVSGTTSDTNCPCSLLALYFCPTALCTYSVLTFCPGFFHFCCSYERRRLRRAPRPSTRNRNLFASSSIRVISSCVYRRTCCVKSTTKCTKTQPNQRSVASHRCTYQSYQLFTLFFPPQDPECTFQPKINQSAAKRQGRSVVELSRGDMLKKETAQVSVVWLVTLLESCS